MFYKKLSIFILAIFLITGILFPLYIILKSIFNFYLEIEIFCLTLILLFLTFMILYFLEKDYETIEKKDEFLLLDDDIYKELKKEEVVVVKNIIKSYSNNSFFSLAIIGPWGSGKSSFLWNLKELIENDKVISLNVWELENIENIIQEIEKEFDNIIFESNKKEWFFHHLKSIFIRNYFSTLSKYISEDVIKINLSFTQTIQESKRNYNDLLIKSLKDKKIIIMLDEIDRLNNKEDILNIFKFIRYLSSFNKVFTITALDIDKIGEQIGLDYTHKIFNSKYMLPKISKTDLYNFLKDTISTKLSKSNFINKDDFIKILNNNFYGGKNLIDYINTYREIKNCYNDTYILCKNLEEKEIKEWKNYIKFEFIFTLNLIKSLNFDFYLKLINEQTHLNLLIMDLPFGYINGEENKKNESYKNKFEDFMKFGEINKLCFILKNNIKEIDKLLYIFKYHKIYSYMFTELEYSEFTKNTKNTKNIEEKYQELQSKDKFPFINELLNRIQEEDNEENRKKILEIIFKIHEPNLYNYLDNYKVTTHSKDILKKIFELYFKDKEKNKLKDSSFSLLYKIQKLEDKELKYDLYKIMNKFFKDVDFRSEFKKSLFELEELFKENYKSETIILMKALHEQIEDFFENNTKYRIFNDEKKDSFDYLKGEEIKESCNQYLAEISKTSQ
ncbi:P-loop NTPase fold protein [Aliarcobacter butzleri]|uniref:P-loop NTPase fold protein n=1 Tax=Aliarcobacter butzleri TaxID=28197 RepID=UPI001EDBBE8C|nr:P-loop NTPase fold protein [Aliarcobacter butzleri]MCG3686812.1 KAP family NTPase [Aliarcobacter butzleri]